MSKEALLKLAEELKQARDEQEITLQQVYNKTRIDVKFLKAIEEGNFDILPAVYVKAFVKEFARAISLDPDEILKKYEQALAGKEKKSENEETGDSEDSGRVETNSTSDKKGKLQFDSTSKGEDTKNDLELNKNPYKNIYIGAALIIVLAVALYFILKGNSEPTIITEKPIDEVIQQQKEKYEEPVREKKPAIEETTDSLLLGFTAIDTTWCQVYVDEGSPTEFMLFPNRSKSIKAQTKFYVTLGNAGGVQLTLNNQQLAPIGKPGEVKNIMVNSEGFHYITISELPGNDKETSQTENQ
jgi:hypothetical protein